MAAEVLAAVSAFVEAEVASAVDIARGVPWRTLPGEWKVGQERSISVIV